jgi:hypothetical protein
MLLDETLEFGDAVALNTGAANTYLLGDQIDLGAAGEGVSDGGAGQLYLVLTVDTSVDSAGDGVTLQFHLASDDTASVSTTTSTRHFSTPVFTQAQLVAGARFAFPLPPSTLYERFLGLLQTTAVEAVTVGKVNAFLTRDIGYWKAFPDAI